MRRILILIGLVAFSITAFGSELVTTNADSDVHSADADRECAALVANINKARNLQLLYECHHHYWHGGDDPLGGQYTSMVKIGRRIVALDPMDAEMYTNTAWLEWSGYATWLKDPAAVPDGAGRADSAVQLLNQGLKYLSRDVAYRKDAADTIWPLASHYRKDFLPFVIDNYSAVISLTNDKNLKIRATLNIAHVYRKDLVDKTLAIEWYKKVLVLDPENKVAKNYLAQLETEFRKMRTKKSRTRR